MLAWSPRIGHDYASSSFFYWDLTFYHLRRYLMKSTSW
ncbi:unnamed protein product [Amoebophrya sp. A25]|nr:unnamed protein product [Amoebophrya sp. A25]|eukprot:GSA25T00024059001.1